MRIEPLQAFAAGLMFVLGGVIGVTGYLWHKMHVPAHGRTPV